MKTKYFIFNLMFGSYESAVHIFKGETIDEIVKNNEELQDCKIKNFNYNPETDIDKFSYLNNHNNILFKPETVDFRDGSYKSHSVFNNDYETLVKNNPNCNNGYNKGVSGKLFLETNEEFYDWVEIYGDFPENYKFSDGHSG